MSIRELGILRDFPDRSEADLYLWISKRRTDIEDELGWQVPHTAVALDLAEQEGAGRSRLAGRVSKRVLDIIVPDETSSEMPVDMSSREKIADASNERLFKDILVAVSGFEKSWIALEQAVSIAQKEGGQLLGLYVVPQAELQDDAQAHELRDRFLWRCGEFGLESSFAVDVGQVGKKICERARWTDLVVVNLAHPPQDSALSRFQSGFRNLINRCTRPVLAVPGVKSEMANPLLAYDGSPKSEEALYIATYLTGRWQLSLTVVTVEEEGVTNDKLVHAQKYLEDHGIQAEYELAQGLVPDTILAVAESRGCDLVIMGGYGGNSLRAVVLGTAVDVILNRANIPIIICR